MMETTPEKLFAAWRPWQVATALTAALEMRRTGLSPEKFAALAREWLDKEGAGDDVARYGRPGAAPYRSPARRDSPRRELARPDWQKEEERGVMLGGACPRCGGLLAIKRMCPRVSPRIRTQLACNNDACDWMAVSEHPWDYLAREGLEGNVEVQ